MIQDQLIQGRKGEWGSNKCCCGHLRTLAASAAGQMSLLGQYGLIGTILGRSFRRQSRGGQARTTQVDERPARPHQEANNVAEQDGTGGEGEGGGGRERGADKRVTKLDVIGRLQGAVTHALVSDSR